MREMSVFFVEGQRALIVRIVPLGRGENARELIIGGGHWLGKENAAFFEQFSGVDTVRRCLIERFYIYFPIAI